MTIYCVPVQYALAFSRLPLLNAWLLQLFIRCLQNINFRFYDVSHVLCTANRKHNWNVNFTSLFESLFPFGVGETKLKTESVHCTLTFEADGYGFKLYSRDMYKNLSCPSNIIPNSTPLQRLYPVWDVKSSHSSMRWMSECLMALFWERRGKFFPVIWPKFFPQSALLLQHNLDLLSLLSTDVFSVFFWVYNNYHIWGILLSER